MNTNTEIGFQKRKPIFYLGKPSSLIKIIFLKNFIFFLLLLILFSVSVSYIAEKSILSMSSAQFCFSVDMCSFFEFIWFLLKVLKFLVLIFLGFQCGVNLKILLPQLQEYQSSFVFLKNFEIKRCFYIKIRQITVSRNFI